MSKGNGQSSNGQGFLQELRSNRRTQGMAALFVVVLALMVWWNLPEGKKARPRTSVAGPAPASSATGDPRIAALDRLPDLGKLDRAGELPKDSEMSRDLFLFDARAAETWVYEIFVPPPPAKSEEQLKAEREALDKQQQASTRPSGVRYIGYLANKRQGQVGAFMKGEEPITLLIGDLSFPGWKLVKLDDTGAEFQNIKYPDLRHKVQPTDPSPTGPGTVRNEF